MDATGIVLISSIHITSSINYRLAKTLLTYILTNPKPGKPAQKQLNITIPAGAVITSLDVSQVGVGVSAKISRKIEGHSGQQCRRTTPPRICNLSIDVNVSGPYPVKVVVTYEHVIIPISNSYHYVIYITPGQVLQELDINIHIKESREIVDIKVPEVKNGVLNDYPHIKTIIEKYCDPNVKMVYGMTRCTAYLKYNPSADEQRKMDRTAGINGDFVLYYKLHRTNDIWGDLMVSYNYLLHFIYPCDLAYHPRDVIFIQDLNPSKIKDEKSTASSINHPTKCSNLNIGTECIIQLVSRLRDNGDRFNIITCSKHEQWWRESAMVPSHSANVQEATGYLLRETRTPIEGTADMCGSIISALELFNKSLIPESMTQLAGSALHWGLSRSWSNVKRVTSKAGLDLKQRVRRSIVNQLPQTFHSYLPDSEVPLSQGENVSVKHVIVVVTDGVLTFVRGSSAEVLRSRVSARNAVAAAPIHFLGVSVGADTGFMRTISNDSGGSVHMLRNRFDTWMVVNDLYKLISKPTLSDLNIAYKSDTIIVSNLIQRNSCWSEKYYEGDEICMVGQLIYSPRHNESTTSPLLKCEVTGKDATGQSIKYTKTKKMKQMFQEETTLQKLYTHMLINDLLVQSENMSLDEVVRNSLKEKAIEKCVECHYLIDTLTQLELPAGRLVNKVEFTVDTASTDIYKTAPI